MAVCPGHGHSSRACSITGAGGVALVAGDVLTTAAAKRALVIANGLAKFTYELPLPGSNPAAGHLYLNSGHISEGHEDVWLTCFDPSFGDYAYFVTTPLIADRIRVVEASDDAVEVTFEWDAHSLGSPGLVEVDPANYPNYNDAAALQYVTTVFLQKVVRMERGKPGYFLAYRSRPEVVPEITGLGALNNDVERGERECGTGGGTAVVWSSAGRIAYFGAWRDQRDWSAVLTAFPSFNNFAWWAGIDDPTHSVWADATVIAMQPEGYPHEQTSGYLYVADIPVAAAGCDNNVYRIVVQKNPLQIGCWGYAGQYGVVVNHLTNAWVERDGRRTRFPVFLGAGHHTPDPTAVAKAGYTGNVAYGNEPTANVQAKALALATAVTEDWPE